MARLRDIKPARVFTVGATCGCETAPVAYLSQRYGERLGVVWIDAHGDLNTPATSPSRHYHGMVLRTLMGEGPREIVADISVPLVAARTMLAGVRDLDAPEREFVERAGVGLVEEWPEGIEDTVVAALADAGVEQVYIHIDCDVFDPLEFGDALFSVPGGPGFDQVAVLTRALASRFDVVGVGVVEFCGQRSGSDAAIVGFLQQGGLWPMAD